MSRPLRRLFGGATFVALFAGVVAIQLVRDRVYGEPRPADSLLYVRSPEVMRRLSLSFSAIVADVYWIRAVQYYGARRRAGSPEDRYEKLYPLLDIATSLDTRFNTAYRFGAVFLSEPFPGGAGRPDLAIALLEKGFRLNPHRWHYLYDIAFVHYWIYEDFLAASKWFRKAAEVPGAPFWVRTMAGVTATLGGNRQASRELFRLQLENAENDWVRESAIRRLQQLDSMDRMDTLTEASREFASRNGRFARSLQELAEAQSIEGPLADATGAPFVLDQQSGVVTLSPGSSLNPLPTGERIR
jgi:hypothetical protein